MSEREGPARISVSGRPGLAAGWVVAVGLAVGVRVWNALTGSLMWGYDAWGHVAYVFFVDAYRAVPWADQGWSYFHPPLHYAFGWALAQLGSGELLVRGLSGVGAAASLGTAVLAAWVVRMASPGQPALSLLGFCAVAFLPAHVFVHDPRAASTKPLPIEVLPGRICGLFPPFWV